jgi:hypothetical protein
VNTAEVQTSAQPQPAPRRPRHRWLKLRLHVRICLKCGTGRVNAQGPDGWFATFHRPDGTAQVRRHVPACEVGPLTSKYLAKYRDRLAVPF